MVTAWKCQLCDQPAHERWEDCQFYGLIESSKDRCICGESRLKHERGNACPQFDAAYQYVTGQFKPLA